MSWRQHVPPPENSSPELVPARFEQQNPGPGKYLKRDTDIDVISIPAIGADPKFTWIRYTPKPEDEIASREDLSPPANTGDGIQRKDWSNTFSTSSFTNTPLPGLVTGSNPSPTQRPEFPFAPSTSADARRHTVFIPSGGIPSVGTGGGPGKSAFNRLEPFRSSSSLSSEDRPRSRSISPQRLPQLRRISVAPLDDLKLKPRVEPVVEWLGQPLRNDVPRARVAHYRHPVHHGYLLEDFGRSLLRFILEDREQFDSPEQSQMQSTMRPIFFVCHSTGGLVLKKALVLAMSLSGKVAACRQFIKDTVGVCFFAVPHSGSAVLSDPSYRESVTSTLRLRYIDPLDLKGERNIDLPMSDGLSNELSPTNEDLTSLNTNFVPIARRMKKIWTFIEARDVKCQVYDATDQGYRLVKKSRRIVTRPSATLSTSVNPIPVETLEEIPGNHASICSFPAEKGLYARNFRISLQHFLSNVIQAQLAREDVVVKHVPVQIHHFLRVEESLTVTTVNPVPSLYDFLEKGPTSLIQDSRKRLEKSHGLVRTPAVFIRPPSPESGSVHSKHGEQVLVESSLLPPQVDGWMSDGKEKQPAPAVLTQDTLDVFTWTHVPFTCPRWVPDVLNRIMREKTDNDVSSTILKPEFWANKQHRARHNSPHARFLKPACSMVDQNQSQMVLYMPYLHWDTFDAFQARTRAIRDRLAAGDIPHAKADMEAEDSLENQMIKQYLVGNEPLHCRRTLDQFGYPMLRDTSDRDLDQILFKCTGPEVLDEDMTNGFNGNLAANAVHRDSPKDDGARKMLMVDTMWLFVLNKENIVSFFPRKEKGEDSTDDLHLESDLHKAIHDEANLDELPQYTVLDFAALAVKQAIGALLGETAQPKVDPTLEVFRIFEEYINVLTESQTTSFKAFRDRIEITFRKIKTIKEWQAAGPTNDDEHDFTSLLEFRDIEDELATMGKLFEAQSQVVAEMRHHYDKSSYGAALLETAAATLEGYMAQHHEMAERAKSGRQSAIALLDMKQKQANVDEAVQARIQAQEAAGQSRIILVFTIFTVIFLPLSFFTSLFGMNVKEWSGTPTNPSTHQVIVYMCSISFVVIFVAFLLAFVKSARDAVQNTTFNLPYFLSSACLSLLTVTHLYSFVHAAYMKIRKILRRAWHVFAPASRAGGTHATSRGRIEPAAKRVPDGLLAVIHGLGRPQDRDLEAGLKTTPSWKTGDSKLWTRFQWDQRKAGGKGGFDS